VPPPSVPPSLRGRVFRGRDAVASGLLTSERLRSTAWRRLYRGIYADASLPDTHGVRIAGAALLVPSSAAFAGRSAAYLYGAEALVDAETPVDVVVPAVARFGPVAGLRIRVAPLGGDDVRTVGRHLCTVPLRTALDIARLEAIPESVVALDVMLARGLVRPGDLAEAVSVLPPGRGTRRARTAVGLSDERAESPPESRLRVLLRLAGLTPQPQYVVRDRAGVRIARVDLAFPEQRVAIEYDGVWHGAAGQLAKDRRRLNKLVQEGWKVLHLTAADMYDPAAVVAAVRRLLASCEIGEFGL
jgi:very-short-patch-repair endonuclease